MADLPSDETIEVIVRDSTTSNNELTVTAAGAAKVDGSDVTQPVSAASLPLPTGAATSALQATGNTSLSSIAAGTPAALGQSTMANSQRVVIASNQSAVPITASAVGKTPQLKTGQLVSVATTADQVILTYTVTAAKTLFMTYFKCNAYRTTLPGNVNPIFLGNVSLESPAGTKLITFPMFHMTDDIGFSLEIDEDFWVLAGTVIRVVVTPSAATSTTWRVNFGGYEI